MVLLAKPQVCTFKQCPCTDCTLIYDAEGPCATVCCALLRKRLQVQIEDSEALFAWYRARVITLEARVRLLLEAAQRADFVVAPELLQDEIALEVHMSREQGLCMGPLVPVSDQSPITSVTRNPKRARH